MGELKEGHGPFEKHLQLGTDLDADRREEITDDAEIDALWGDQTTVDQFADDLAALKHEDPLTQWELARLRQEGS